MAVEMIRFLFMSIFSPRIASIVGTENGSIKCLRLSITHLMHVCCFRVVFRQSASALERKFGLELEVISERRTTNYGRQMKRLFTQLHVISYQ